MGITNKLAQIGQSLWFDNIQRSMLENGQIEGMISRGEIKGMTSNPSIFQNAIAKSSDYNPQLQTLAWAGFNAEAIFWNLAIDDVQKAADIFKDLYLKTNKSDGYVSIEVNPNLAHDTKGTIKEAVDLWKRINRPNLMVKVPATKTGIPAIKSLISQGINVNITLIFSIQLYREVVEAYISGLEERIRNGKSIDTIASVASFFVSRVDTKTDGLLADYLKKNPKDTEKVNSLLGKAGIYNARKAYQIFQEEFKKDRFQKLVEKGARLQRPLWASTSTKNPAYKDVMYVEELIGANTVDTVPPATLNAFLDHGIAQETIKDDQNLIDTLFVNLKNCGISIDRVTDDLETEGVQAFSDAYNGLLKVIEERRAVEVKHLGLLANNVIARLGKLEKENFLSRMFKHDASLWTESPEGQKEIIQRMDWLEAPWHTDEVWTQLDGLLDNVQKNGFTHVLILGMGGSSLAPEVFSSIYQANDEKETKGLRVSILDSTHPDEVVEAAGRSPLEQTLFVVASKSGTTGEINAFYNFFFDKYKKDLGERAGSHFMAITDPGTKLEQLAKEKKFRKIILANPKVGGRNSALTAFGLTPADLLGIDIKDLAKPILYHANWFLPENPLNTNPGIVLGAILGEAALNGHDKLTILADDEWNTFASWMEQLVAESTGKNGKGILPIAEEPISLIGSYHKDRLFVYLRKNGKLDALVGELNNSGHPVIQLYVNSSSTLGYQFYLWEVAVATACSIMGVNSFDQPDVQDAKTRTLAGIASYRKTGQFIIDPPLVKTDDYALYSKQKDLNLNGESPIKAIQDFINAYSSQSTYVAFNAFVSRNLENSEKLNQLRKWILDMYGLATTLGFGPRFLHSTGQLQKGGPNNGLFIMITNTPLMDVAIPGEGITFGKFCLAQALGDESALNAKGRKVLRIHFSGPGIDFGKLEN